MDIKEKLMHLVVVEEKHCTFQIKYENKLHGYFCTPWAAIEWLLAVERNDLEQ